MTNARANPKGKYIVESYRRNLYIGCFSVTLANDAVPVVLEDSGKLLDPVAPTARSVEGNYSFNLRIKAQVIKAWCNVRSVADVAADVDDIDAGDANTPNVIHVTTKAAGTADDLDTVVLDVFVLIQRS
jgi:hypothetical protein